MPCTNNDLEHYFGAACRQERRATGRKSAAAGTVVRGPERVVAAVATSADQPDATTQSTPGLLQIGAWRAEATGRIVALSLVKANG